MSDHELNFQRKVIEAVRQLGGHGLKMSNRFTSGIPDLLLEFGTTWIVEVKLVLIPVRPTDQVKVALTVLQQQTILKFQAAGSHCGLMLANIRPGETRVMCTRRVDEDEIVTQQEFLSKCLIKLRTQPLAHLLGQGLLDPLLSPYAKRF